MCRCSMPLGVRRALADCCGGAQEPDDRIRDLAGRRPDIDGQGILVGSRLLEGIDLTLQQACRHEMAVAPRQMLGDEIAATAKVDETYFRPITDDDLTIGSLECRASDDPRLLLGALPVDPGGHALEPGLAI